MTFSEQNIDLGVGKKSDILSSTAKFFKKVRLDTYTLKNLNKIYESYNIPKDEQIIAYCKASIFGVHINGVIFTDKAVYSITNQENCIKVIYIDLCKYIITRQYDEGSGEYLSNHGGVFLRNHFEEKEIFCSTLIMKNTAAEEIFDVLTAIQNELHKINPNAQLDMENTIENIFRTYKNKMIHGEINATDNVMLRVIQNKKEYSDKVILLLAENKYRLLNEDIYNQFLETANTKNAEILQKFKNPQYFFAQDYISDLSNLNLKMSFDYLKKVCKHAEKKLKNKKNKIETLIYTLLLARTNNFYDSRAIIFKTIKDFGYNSVTHIEDFVLLYGNIQMRKVYSNIINNVKINEDLINVVDGIGLTPLHYALIFETDDIVNDLLYQKDWCNSLPIFENNELKMVYDYTIISAMKGKKNLYKIICSTDSEIKQLYDLLSKIKSQSKEAWDAVGTVNDCLNDANRRLYKMQKSNADYYEIQEMKERIQELRISYNKAFNVIDECKMKIVNLEKEIIKKYKAKEVQILNNLKILINSKNPIVKLLLEIYENRQDGYNINKILNFNELGDMRIYNYKNYSILLPNNIILDLPYRKINIMQDGRIKHNETQQDDIKNNTFKTPAKPYNDSWFSPEAHIIRTTLIAEYRKLVKLYHPDVCKEEYANKIFIEIADEYNSLSKT